MSWWYWSKNEFVSTSHLSSTAGSLLLQFCIREKIQLLAFWAGSLKSNVYNLVINESALKAVIQLWCPMPCRVQPNAPAIPSRGCQAVLLRGWGQCIAMHDGRVYICKLYSVRNVPRHWNLANNALKLLKHLEFQPLPDRTLLENSQALTRNLVSAMAHIQQALTSSHLLLERREVW